MNRLGLTGQRRGRGPRDRQGAGGRLPPVHLPARDRATVSEVTSSTSGTPASRSSSRGLRETLTPSSTRLSARHLRCRRSAEYTPRIGPIVEGSRSSSSIGAGTVHKAVSGIFPPDIGICPDCLMDMADRGGRWFEYPFTACAWCGPTVHGRQVPPLRPGEDPHARVPHVRGLQDRLQEPSGQTLRRPGDHLQPLWPKDEPARLVGNG